MKITWVGFGEEQLAISLLAGLLEREGHQSSLVFNPALFNHDGFFEFEPLANFLDRTDHIVDQVVEQRPDLVAFSVLTITYKWSLQIAAAIKARIDVPVIFGGVHPSAVPEICLENDCVDYVCVGEGEDALVRLCEVLPSSSHERPAQPIANLRWWDGDRYVEGENSPFLQDLDSLPHFRKDLWKGKLRPDLEWMTMSSRGCPYRCTFCFNNFFAKLPGKGGGKYLRQRSIEHMIEELVDAKREWGIRRINFQDDIFTADRQWLRGFLEEFKREVDVPFQCLVHPRYVDDDIARWLHDAGCQHVQMGVQSVDEEYKRHELLRMEKDSHLRASLASLAEHRVDLKLDHILGLPGEPLEAQELAREVYAEYPPRRIQTFWLTHLPGVELTKSAVARGEVSEEEYAALNRGETQKLHNASNGHQDESHYRRYEILFRLLTVLPGPLRDRLRVKHIPVMSTRMNQFVGMSAEVANSIINRDAETWTYIRYHAWQVPRQARGAMADRRRARRTGRVLGQLPAPRLRFPDGAPAIPAPTCDLPAAPEPELVGTGGVSVQLAPRRA